VPKISVIIPVYNVEKYLSRCLDSVTNQTLKDIEIICINDGSTDKSLTILKKYASKDKRIEIIDLKENVGAGEVKNKGLKIVKGQYLGFVDSDDYIDLDFYEKLYQKAIETGADIVKTELITVETDGTKKKNNLNNFIKEKSKFYFSYEYTSAIYKSSVIFDNKIIFPTELIVGEDVVFLHKTVLKAKIIEVINNTNYYYVRRLNSLNTQTYDKERMISAIKTIEYMAKNYDKSYETDITRNQYLSEYYSNMLSLIEYTINKTYEKELKLECVKKFIELYNKCKLSKEIDNIFENNYPEIFDIIKKNNIEKLLEIIMKYRNFQNFSLIEQLRKNVKKDMKNA